MLTWWVNEQIGSEIVDIDAEEDLPFIDEVDEIDLEESGPISRSSAVFIASTRSLFSNPRLSVANAIDRLSTTQVPSTLDV